MQELGFPLYSDFYDIADVPRYDFSTRQIIDQAPKTNVGIVSLPSGQYTFPRSDDARSLLNYGPTAGEDTSSFIRDSDGNIIRNTELNPFNPSSQFFPYEPDYAGIMSTKAYLEDKGLPLRADPELETRGAGKTVDTGPYGFYVRQQDPEIKTDRSGNPYKLTIEDAGMIYINPTAHRDVRTSALDTTELRDTIFHEGKHYFIDRFGQAVPITKGLQYEGLGGIRRRGPAGMFGSPTIPDDKREGQHGTIYFADIFRNSPFLNMILDPTGRGAAYGFMEMHNYAKNVLKKANKEDKTVLEVLNEDAQDAFRNQQKKNVDEIKEEVKSGGGGPAGMFGTPAGTGQTGGPAGMGFAPSNNPTGFGSNIRIGKAKGGLVSINHLTRGM